LATLGQATSLSALGRVALLGIAQRIIYVTKPLDMKKPARLNALKDKAKTMGDWLK
jgi:hypothetical protein